MAIGLGECRYLQILHVVPTPLAIDQLSFCNVRLSSQRVLVIGNVDGADRWFYASFGQTLGVSNGQIMPTAIRVMNQSALLNSPSMMQRLLK